MALPAYRQNDLAGSACRVRRHTDTEAVRVKADMILRRFAG